jgi:hydroxyethylthiazole kinase-like uncharacterized protein yjeF
VKGVPVLTHEEIRAVEDRARSTSPSLMERAGRAVANAARRLASDTGAPILVVAGPGNNGGDAWVAAAHLMESFHRVTVLDATGTTPKAPEARIARDGFASRGGEVVRQWPAAMKPALVVDGLLGIGLARDVDGGLAEIIHHLNACGAPVLAIDVPSGLDSASGRVRGCAVRAKNTITFIAHKVGLHTADGLDYAGAVECDDLGTGAIVAEVARGALLTCEAAREWLAPRKRNSHKGDFGDVSVIGGNRGMVGAALLAGRAALFCGAGKVRVALLSPDAPAVDALHPELMIASVDDALAGSVIVAGPGAGQSPSSTSVTMFERTVLPAVIHLARPIVLDADALNTIAYNATLETALAARTEGPTILTPHPAEAARLMHRSTAQIGDDRLAAALALARRFNAHVVLKGAGSICASPDGRWWINTTGNVGLASGGTGDVLAGMIGAFLAQKLEPAQALGLAVSLHGASADRLVANGCGPVGMTASEVSIFARQILNERPQ